MTDRARAIREVLYRYLAQSDPERVEVVVAALPGADLGEAALDADTRARIRSVPVDVHSLAQGEARAIRAARAPLVLLAQGHAHPEPGFLEAMLEPFETDDWAFVAPTVQNANPERACSWAGMWLHYGGERLPAHSSVYDRGRLLALGERLETLLDAGAGLQDALRARGGRSHHARDARVSVVQVSHFGWFLVDQFAQAAKFGADRRLAWSGARRLLYALGSPLIPLLRLRKIVAELRRQRRLRELGSRWPALAAGLVASALGEALGYALGNLSERRRADLALHRLDYVARPERARLG